MQNNDQTKYTVAILIAVVIIGLLFYYRKADAPTVQDEQQTVATTTPSTGSTNPTIKAPVAKPAPSSEIVVIFTGTSFIPKTLTIKAGQSVTFLNKSDKGMWVTSDPYSEKNSYPELNQEKTVAKNGSYKFTFNTPGSWSYQHQNMPEIKGFVIVR